jgi:hypothetical protein
LGMLADQREALRAIFEDRRIASPIEGRKRLQASVDSGSAEISTAQGCQTHTLS